jgi:2-oxoglutarate/2-oxoacid ferredoxin oxidoreductase subunit alpha
VLVAELNLGQLQLLIRARYLVDATGLHKVKGRPFKISELTEKIQELL